MSLLARSSRSHLRRHPAQLALSLLGIALGVSVVVAVDLAVQSARRAFQLSSETVTGRATHQVTGGPDGVDEGLYRALRVDFGVREAAPVVDGYVRERARRVTLHVMGVDPFAEAPFRSYASRAGGLDPTVLLTQPGAFVASRATADRLGWRIGQRYAVQVSGMERVVTLTGVLDPQDALSSSALENLLIGDISSAQELLGTTGRLSRIDIIANGSGAPAVLQRVRSALPPGSELLDSGARTRQVVQMTRAFDLNLTALSLVTLVFGMFLIYNSVMFSVVQRRPLFGALRTLGVTRSEIFRVVLTEAALIGSAGVLLGLVFGVLLGSQLVHLVTRTVNDLYFVVTVRELAIPPIALAKGALLGMMATLLAAFVPAAEATGTQPRMTLARSSLEQNVLRLVPRLAALGAAAAGVAALLLVLSERSLIVSFIGIFLLIFAFALLTPLAILLLARVLRLAAAPFGMLARMAAGSLTAAISRTAPAIAALSVAIAVGIAVGAMITSFRSTVVEWLGQTLQADVYVSAPSFASNRPDATLDTSFIRVLAAAPGVAAISMYRNVHVQTSSGPVNLIAARFATQHLKSFQFKEKLPGDPWSAFAGGELLVSEPFAYRNRVRAGADVQLLTDKGWRAFRVRGVFYDYASEQGVVFLHRSAYDQFWRDRRVSSAALFAQPGVDVNALTAELASMAPDGQTINIRSNRALREASLEVFDRTFAITAVLRILALVVAFIGVLAALMALQLERARELGVLRATGLTPAQVWKLVSTQTALMGVIAGVLAVPLGALLAYLMVAVVNRRSFGWTLQLDLSPPIFLQGIALATIAALLAGAYPAWRMARTRPALALREE